MSATLRTRARSLISVTFLAAHFSPLAARAIVRFFSKFLYHSVSDPFTGRRCSTLPSSTNHTGSEIFRPDDLPVTVILISSVLWSVFLRSLSAMSALRQQRICQSWDGKELRALESYVLVGGEGIHRDDVDGVVGHPRSHPDDPTQVHEGGEHRPVDGELLDAMENGFAFGRIALAALLQEHLVEVGIAAVRVAALRVDERLDAARGVARIPHRDEKETPQLLLLPGRVERGALHRPHPHPDAHGVQAVERGITHRGKTGNGHELSGVETVRIASL